MKCEAGCTYSRRINQPYPRLCIHCKTPENTRTHGEEWVEGMEINTTMHLIKFWKEKVELARQMMSAAIHDFDQSRSRLAEEERHMASQLGHRKYWTCASCLGIYLDTQDCPNCKNPMELKSAKSP